MLLKKLTDACGLPGFEDEVREIIREEIEPYVDSLRIDRMGNLIAVKNQNAEGRHIALSAHMDEVGVVVIGIDDKGLLHIGPWGTDPRILPSKPVKVGKSRVPGVIGTKPVHLTTPEEREKAIPMSDLFVDIGAKSREDAEKYVAVGDFVAFDSEWTEFGEYKVKAKALDDRVGCAVIIEMLKSDIPYKLTGIFNVQEEVGLRGSQAAANQVFVDLVLNLEGTICADTADADEAKHVTTQGLGAAISLVDRSSIYLKKYIEAMERIAAENGIPYQFRRTAMGGTDAASFHGAHGGTPVIGLSVPCRYIHSPVSVMDMRDYDSMTRLVSEFIRLYNEKDLFGEERR